MLIPEFAEDMGKDIVTQMADFHVTMRDAHWLVLDDVIHAIELRIKTLNSEKKFMDDDSSLGDY